MNDPPAIAAARQFLALVLEEPQPSEEALARSLDRLALASHDIPDVECADVDDHPPRPDYQTRYKLIGARFPEFGLYASVEPANVLNEEPTVRDAIDDLVDIASDMEQAIWRLEHLGVDDAHWFLNLLRFHWDRHLRGLSLYLHGRRFGDTSDAD